MDSSFVEMLKRFLGILWMLLGLYVALDSVFGIHFSQLLGFGPYIDSLGKIQSPKLADHIFGWILLLVLTPIISFSLWAFGYLSIAGDYAKD